MDKCPICNYSGLKGAPRCPKCQSTLTTWINFDQYGQEAYQAALFELAEGRPQTASELMLQAVLLAPENPIYMSSYGRILGQLGRYAEAAMVLEEAYNLNSAPDIKAALDKATSLTPEAEPAIVPEESTEAGSMGMGFGAPAPVEGIPESSKEQPDGTESQTTSQHPSPPHEDTPHQ